MIQKNFFLKVLRDTRTEGRMWVIVESETPKRTVQNRNRLTAHELVITKRENGGRGDKLGGWD